MDSIRNTFAMAALVLAATGTLSAQQATPGAPPDDLLKQVRQKQAEIQELSQKLAKIQQETIEANPELADQRDELIDLVDSKMAESGHDPAASREKIEKLQGQLDSGELSKEESQSVGQELRAEQSELQQAQGQAMQDQEVRQGVQTLQQDLVEAMKKHDPKAEELIAKLETAQQEYQALMQQAMQMQQQSRPQPPQQR